MQIMHCGFLGLPPHSTILSEVSLLQIDDSSLKGESNPVSGGWGYVGVVTQGLLQLQSSSVAQLLSSLPDGHIAAAALAWQHASAVSDTGRLYECSLPAIQPADSSKDQSEHLPVRWRDLSLAKPVRTIAAGELHSAALTADGTVWTWGSNTDCQLGRPLQQDSASDHTCPRAVAGPEAPLAEAGRLPAHLGGYEQGMTAIACGARHTCAVGGMGQLFCWGWSLHGQCGQGRAVVTVLCPHLVSGLGGLKVTGVAAGLGHTVACTDGGDVYSWGWNADGQLGLGDDQSRGEPELVSHAQLEDVHINQVSCGARHTLVMDKQGRAYSWGWNKYGQLGLGDMSNRLVPCCILLDGSVECVACGWWHSMLNVSQARSYQ
ncbi:hypothetical protein WJX77_009849 [Trebouxia sp. C0004]